ncbi:MAG: NUDIX domain-containing protein [Polyangiaceae bacterium]|nr:NUDIX domain-containing protein [Polyangiaceae bacterium]
MSDTPSRFDAAVLIGRFQPFHEGHRSLLVQALELAPEVIVVVASSYQARSPRNPWTWEERARTIRDSVAAAARDRITAVPVRDYYDEKRWRAQIERRVRERLGEARKRVVLVGHFEGRSSKGLGGFVQYAMRSLPRQLDIDATSLRDLYFGAAEGGLPDGVVSLGDQFTRALPPSSLLLLQESAATEDYARVADEWASYRRYRALWKAAPFAPIFVTVDAVVTCRGQVLLIKRGHHPGKGLLGLPGGFVEPDETTLEAALRELEEETRLDLGGDSLDDVLRDRAVFDHPERSQRGRSITHAFHFDLGDGPPPPVQAGDDAAGVEWVDIDRLTSLEEQFVDDHFHILDRFLTLPID